MPIHQPRLLALIAESGRRPWTGYAVAVLLTVLALGATLLARDELRHGVLFLFLFGVLISALAGGFGPSLLATALAVLSVDYFILSPGKMFQLGVRHEAVPLVAFALGGLLVGRLAQTQRRIALEVADQAQLLQDQNIELETQMEASQTLQEELEQTGEELAQANEALKRNRDFLEQAQRTALLGSWEWDITTNRIEWSDQMFRVYGLEPGSVDVVFETFSAMVHPEDRALVHDGVAEALRTKQPFSFEHRVVRPDGTVRWVHGSGSVVVNAGGDAIRMLGSGQDITERKRAADAQRLLAEASETLASSLEYTQTLSSVANLAVREVADWCSIAIGDSTGRYSNLAVAHRDPARVKWAEEYSRLNPPRFDAPTGVPQVLRTGKSEFYPEISRELLAASVQSEEELRVIEELEMRSAMVVPMIARGRTIGAITFIAAESRRLFDGNDLWLAERLANRAAIAIDNARLFEEARAARADAEAANAAKAQFLASMSHELRTPLNAIAGYAELMELEVLGTVTDKQRDAIARLQRSRKHLTALVDQVLSFARIEAGRIPLDLTHVPVAEALHTLADMIAPQAEGKTLRYQFAGCDRDVAVRADRDRLDQIVLNLLANAVKYTPSGGSVSVTVDCSADAVRINVIDSGPGIPREKQELIFQPFVQLAPNTDSSLAGVGLGLAISRDLARAMGGDISVSSEVGAGSVFTLTLPRSTGERPAVAADTPSRESSAAQLSS